MKKFLTITLTVLTLFLSLQAKEIGGVKLNDSILIDNQKLILNGAGIRSIFFFDVYVGALYLKDRSNSDKKIIVQNEPMDIKMVITSSMVTSSKMIDGMKEAFEKSKKSGYDINKSLIDRFLTTFKEKISKGDIYDFLYTPGKGVEIYKNQKLLQTIDDFSFKKALFAIWLGKYPAQESLKKKMLGL